MSNSKYKVRIVEITKNGYCHYIVEYKKRYWVFWKKAYFENKKGKTQTTDSRNTAVNTYCALTSEPNNKERKKIIQSNYITLIDKIKSILLR